MKNWRINLVFALVILLWAAVISRLIFIQVVKHDFYQAQALGQQINFKETEGPRGEIFFKDKTKSLAINEEKWRLAILSKKIKEKNKTAESLSGILNISKEKILSEIEKGEYFVIKNDLSKKELEALKNLNLEGGQIENYLARYYPQEKTAAHLAGFVGGEGTGQYGLEGYYQELLQGKEGFQREKALPFFDPESPYLSEAGSDLYLTIDYNIQFIAESLLKEAEKSFGIEAGQIIVVDPNSGKVIALANFPSFNPNRYSEEKDLEIFQNGGLQKLFEPGSVLKSMTMAIGLNEGKMTPDTKYTDKGFVKIGPETIYNYDNRVWGEKTIAQVLENSINTGAVFAQQLIDSETFLKYLEKFGLMEKTDIDLAGEVFSRNENLRQGRKINLATSSFGQGIEITPLQLVRAYCVIANGGKLVKPHLAEKIIEPSGQEIKINPEIGREVINKQTANQLKAMLINVVEQGYDKAARIPGYYVAGKTGTAQIPLQGKAGYDPEKTIQSFIGFAPALNPQFLILVKLDSPQTKTAQYSAVPIFQKLAKYIINYWQIPPDY